MVETRRRDAIGDLITGHALPSGELLWVVSADYRVTSDEVEALILIRGDERENEVPPLDNVIGHLVAIQADAEDD